MNIPSKSTTTPLRRLVPLTLLLLASANLHAQQPMLISLNGDAEVPPVTTSAKGTGHIAVMPATR